VTFSGTFDPGLSPTLSTVGSIAFGAMNTLIMEIGGTSRGSEYDAILASGNLGLGGTLSIALIGGFTPSLGDSFDLFDWSTLSGTFATLNLPALAAGLAWNTTQLTTSGNLSVGLSGDFNNDAVVDAADYVVWRKLEGTSTQLPNDPNPLPIDNDQYNTWRTNFGESGFSGSGNITDGPAIPEPTTIAIVATLGILIQFRRRVR
jgi:hypothetical protein